VAGPRIGGMRGRRELVVFVAVAGCGFRLPDRGGVDGGDTVDGPSGVLDGWTTRRSITIANANLIETLVDFPVLVTLNAGSFDYAGAADDGADLRFATADLAQLLPYDLDRFAPGDRSWIWVRVPVIAPPPAPATQLWLYYGNATAASAADARAVWSDLTSVHHMGSSLDASGNGHLAEQANASKLPLETAGIVGRAYAFDGADDALALASPTAFDYTTTMTASLWMRAPGFTFAFQCMVCKGDNAWRVQRGNNNDHANFGTTNMTGTNDSLDSVNNVGDGGWHHIAATLDGALKSIYVDGVLQGSQTYPQTLGITALPVVFGENQETVPARNWNGDLDEVRLTAVARSAAWIGMEYRMVALPLQTVTVGGREAVP